MGVGRQGWGGCSLFLSFSHRQLALQPRATQAVGDAMPLFLECLQPHQVIYNPQGCARINNPMVYRHLRHPQGVRSWIHYSFVIFFFPLREQSLVMDPKQLTKVCLRCVLVSKCRLTIQNEPSKQNKTKNETKHKNLSQQQKQPRKTLRARMI